MNSLSPGRLALCGFALVGLAACNGGDSPTSPPDAPVFEVTGELNDTGLLLCGGTELTQQPCPQEGLPQQDAEFGRDAAAKAGTLSKVGAGIGGFDWTKLSASGDPLATQNVAWDDVTGTEESGSRWSCVQDNVTGLTWEVKESNPEHPRYAGHTYSWWFDDASINGGVPGSQDGGTCATPGCDTQSYRDWVNENALCGHADWRVPSARELSSIAVLSKVIPAVDTDFFPNTIQPRFFTHHSLAREPGKAWYVYFSDGSVSFTNKEDASHVRLVRGGQQ